MAIRLHYGHHLSPPACSNNTTTPVESRSSSKKTSLSVAAVLKQQQQKKGGRRGDGFFAKPSPLLTALEELASRFGRDMAVVDLERLFRGTSVPGGDHPAETGGSSGRRPLRVAYQGGRGSYCQEAAAEAFHSLSFDSFPCANMEDAFLSLEDLSADRAVIPAENSVDGPIDRNLDLLLRHDEVKIVGELVLPVNHCLLSLKDAQIAGIHRVVSHPQALRHCRGRLEHLNLDVDEVDSAADAAKFVAENGIADTAVIGSKMAAKEFGLQVLEHNFQDPKVNFNRFWQLGLSSCSGSGSKVRPGGTRKTMVAFSLESGVSDLFRAMWIFETRGVRVARVEHRPNRSNPIRVIEKETGKAMHLNYVFVFDLEGSGSDPKVKAAVTGLTEIAGFIRVLGSYTSQCESTRT